MTFSRVALAALCLLPACAGRQGTRTPSPPVASAQAAIPLWASGATGAVGNGADDQPQMTPYLQTDGRATGTAVVIFPGGGYQHLAMEKEGSDIARWLAGRGVMSFVVRYRLGPRYHHPVMLGDAQRAIRIARSRAAEFGVDPRRIGIIGFSAGGHLASTAGTPFDEGVPTSDDPIERASSPPAFMLPLYPAITMREMVTHAGSPPYSLCPHP